MAGIRRFGRLLPPRSSESCCWAFFGTFGLAGSGAASSPAAGSILLALVCCFPMPLRSQTNPPASSAVVPIKVRHGDLLAEMSVNGSQPLEFKVDTGFGINVINPKRVESLGLERVGTMTIIGIAGEEHAD